MKSKKVTKEIKELFDTARSAEGCRDSAIEQCFKTKKAIRFGVIARKNYDKAWALAAKLYPDIDLYKRKYNFERGELEAKNTHAPVLTAGEERT